MDETSSSATTIIKRDKNLQENNEKINGRVWTEFSDIKQVLAGKIIFNCKTSNNIFLCSEFIARSMESKTTRKTST